MRMTIIRYAIILACLAGGTLLFVPGCSHQPSHPPPPLEGADIAVAISGLQEGVPIFYTQRFGEKHATFFILKLDGKVLSFLDACVTCYTKKRGYQYEDGSVICRACGQRFGIYTLEKGLGNCYPIKLPGKVVDGRYRIALLDLERETGKF